MRILESLFFSFPVVLLGAFLILREYEKYIRLRRDTRVRIAYFNDAHFHQDEDLFPGYKKHAMLAPGDFAEMDHDVKFKAEMLRVKPAAYEDFLRIVNGMTKMGLCKHAVITYSVLLVWFLIFLASP